MYIAYLESGDRIHISEYEDSMSGKIFCHEGHLLIAKRGDKVAHHFAHKSRTMCSAHDNVGEWHLWWQNRVFPDCIEISMKPHIADIKVIGYIIEIQHSPMKESVMRERESFYTKDHNLIWIFDCRNIEYRIESRSNNRITLRWIRGPTFPLSGQYKGKVIKIFDFGKKELLVVEAQQGKIILGRALSLDDFDKIYIGSKLLPSAGRRIFHHSL